MLLACGSNGHGQLGLGNTEDRDMFTRVYVPGLDETTDKASLFVVGGGNHTIALHSGRAFVAGSNEGGQLGLADVETDTTQFVELRHPKWPKQPGESVSDLPQWTHASAGWAFSVLVDSDDRVYSTGTGANGELGLGDITSVRSLTEVGILPERVKEICSSVAHTLLLTQSGRVYGWGNSRKGQLDRLETAVSKPLDLDFPLKVEHIAVGREFSLLHLSVGEVYTLAISSSRSNYRRGSSQQKYARVWCGWTTTLYEYPDGKHEYKKKIGTPNMGQLNIHQAAGPAYKQAAAGSEHFIAFDGSSVVSWGWGEHGNTPEPFRVTSPNTRLFAGAATSFIYTY